MPLEPLQSIIFSVFSAVLSIFEMSVITVLMPHKYRIVRLFGWTLFTGITTLLIYFILTAMALAADESEGDVSISN